MGATTASAGSDFQGVQNAYRIPSSAASTNGALVTPNQGGAARPSRAYTVLGSVNSTYTVYLKLYDKASAPVVGTDTPKLTIALSSNTYWNGTTAVAAPSPLDISLAGDIGVSFTNGIAMALTKNPADADNTAIAAGDVTGFNLLWQ